MSEKQKTVYEENKYCMQDVSHIYIGTRFTFAELLEAEDIPFKVRLLVERDVMPKADREDTLESHLYYLDAESFLVRLYEQLKARVKINIIEEKKTLFGKRQKEYGTRLLTVRQLVEMPLDEKKEKGVVVQELIISKLALMSV